MCFFICMYVWWWSWYSVGRMDRRESKRWMVRWRGIDFSFPKGRTKKYTTVLRALQVSPDSRGATPKLHLLSPDTTTGKKTSSTFINIYVFLKKVAYPLSPLFLGSLLAPTPSSIPPDRNQRYYNILKAEMFCAVQYLLNFFWNICKW